MCPKQIYTVFHALIMSRLMYALPAWGGFVSVEQTNHINALLKQRYRYGYVVKIHCSSDLLNSVDLSLFDKMLSKAHCLYPLLPQSEANLNIYAVAGMTLFYPHVYRRSLQEIFRHALSDFMK